MNCPDCGKALRAGSIEAQELGSISNMGTVLRWYPEDQKAKLFRKGAITFQRSGPAFYCDACGKVFAEFEQQ